ncbi:MAG: hypothetical protein B7X99_15375 [Rhizobiales bacterium 17-65-6]|nr:MAG: hypothetical protein B7X99_15375 [Rhizobiales bacterium 17-65-6]
MSGFRTTPNLGPELDRVYPAMPFWDAQLGVSSGGVSTAEASYRLGNVEMGSDGGEYIWVKASADIAATATTGTQVTITFPAYTVATGAGGFFTPVNTAILTGQFFHVRRGAYNAVPA